MIPARYKIQFFQAMTNYFPRDFACHVTSAEARHGGKVTGLMASKHILQDLIEFRPDIVFTDYAAHPCWYTTLYGILRRRHIPLVALLRGDVWRECIAYFHTATFPNKLVGPVHLFAWSSGLQFSDRILAICHWLERIVAERYPNKKVGVLHEGIDPELWLARIERPHNLKRPAIGILQDNNILPKVKGLIWFASVVRDMPDVNFYIAGGGQFTHLVEKAFLGLHNAHLLGRLPYPDGVRRFYQSIDAYALPSGLDCCPATLLEASLSERPVVASKVGGIPELIKQGETGWAIPNGHENLWIERIRALLEDSRLSRKMGRAGRQFILENFSWRIQAERLASILREEFGSQGY